ncbi:MAG: hypothetical protein ABMB14_23860, partial [Myxococcota bacterium]
MATVVRKIGLSLGADICWPAAYEEIVRRLDLAIPYRGDVVKIATERVTVEPFDLAYQPSYDLVLDRLTHWFHTSREWIKKISLDGVYVLNNPWMIQSAEKHTTYVAMMKLGLPIPPTWILPPKEYETGGDWDVTVQRYNRLFDLGKVGDAVGYPAFLKPYDGGGWVGVTRVADERALRAAYDRSGKRVQHLQAAVKDWDLFIRAIGVGPQVNVVKYDPDQPLHDRYRVEFNFVTGDEWQRAARICRTINAFFGWDFNSCEMLRAQSILHPIDYANACPDSQVTSLHFHFPWLVKALLRWTIFNAVTGRRKRLTHDWEQYFVAREQGLAEGVTFDEQLSRYDAIARKWFDTDAFEAFDKEFLGSLDEVALGFFGEQRFYDIVQQKVEALFPKHEVKQFTDHFFGMVQFWRKTER